jgi:hypothetical protein
MRLRSKRDFSGLHHPALADRRPDRDREFVAGLRARPQSSPGRGFSVLYRRAFVELAAARDEGRLPRLLATLERTRLQIIDDWGPELLIAKQWCCPAEDRRGPLREGFAADHQPESVPAGTSSSPTRGSAKPF